VLRFFGGAVFFAGVVLMVINVAQTIRQGSAEVPVEPEPLAPSAALAGGR
jgi:cbb3-type cytochrome oxidase subunit 1